MNAVSSPVLDLARKNERAVLQAFARVSQSRIAEQMGASDSTVSRLKDGPIEQFCLLLAACGLKAMPVDMGCFPRAQMQALLVLARDHLNEIDELKELTCD